MYFQFQWMNQLRFQVCWLVISVYLLPLPLAHLSDSPRRRLVEHYSDVHTDAEYRALNRRSIRLHFCLLLKKSHDPLRHVML